MLLLPPQRFRERSGRDPETKSIKFPLVVLLWSRRGEDTVTKAYLLPRILRAVAVLVGVSQLDALQHTCKQDAWRESKIRTTIQGFAKR